MKKPEKLRNWKAVHRGRGQKSEMENEERQEKLRNRKAVHMSDSQSPLWSRLVTARLPLGRS